MTWFSSTNASVDANGTVVTINDGADTSAVSAGDALILGSNSPTEIKSRAAGQIELVEAWSGSAQNNVNAHVIPTSGDFTSATAALREATQTTQDNFAANEAWGTQLGTVDYTGYDGVTYTARTLQQMDADVQEVQDGNQEIIDTAVEDKIGEIRYSKLDNPLCHLFKKNKLVDTLAGDLTWTRASTATYVDRYGVVQTAAIDEPREEADGWLVEGASTNTFLYSGDQSNNSFWSNSDKTVTRVPSEDFGILTPCLHVPDATNQIHTLFRQYRTPTAGNATATYIIKPEEYGIVQFGSNISWSPTSGHQLCRADFHTGTILSGSEFVTQMMQLANGYWVFSHKFTVDVTVAGTATCQLFSNEDQQTWQPDGVSGIYVAAAQLEELPFATSYIPTTDAAATRAEDVRNTAADSAPDVAKPFSFAVNLNNHNSGSFNKIISVRNSSSTFPASISTTESGQYYIQLITEGGGVYAIGSVKQEDNPNPHLVGVYDGSSIKLYIDGEIVKNVSISDSVVSGDSLRLVMDAEGRGQTLNGYDYRVYDFALNEAEIKFLAGE